MVWASLEVKKCGLCLKLKVLIAKATRWQSNSSAKSLSKYSDNFLNAGNWIPSAGLGQESWQGRPWDGNLLGVRRIGSGEQMHSWCQIVVEDKHNRM
jgi:hypothetical protein